MIIVTVISVLFISLNFMLTVVWVNEVGEHHVVHQHLRQPELCIRGISVTLTADSDAA